MADNNGNEHLESVSNNEQTDKSIIERPQISWWARLLGGSTLADIMEQADRYLQEATKMRMDVEGENAQLAQTKEKMIEEASKIAQHKLEEERRQLQEDRELDYKEMQEREKDLDARKRELDARERELDERKKALDEREAAFRHHEAVVTSMGLDYLENKGLDHRADSVAVGEEILDARREEVNKDKEEADRRKAIYTEEHKIDPEIPDSSVARDEAFLEYASELYEEAERLLELRKRSENVNETREESKKRDMDYKVLVARMIGALQRYRESLPEKEKNLPVIDGCTLTKFIQDRAKEILPSGIRTDESSLSYVFKNNDDTVDLLAKEVFLGHNLGVESVHSYFGVNSYGDINNRDGYRDPRMVRKSNFIKSL